MFKVVFCFFLSGLFINNANALTKEEVQKMNQTLLTKISRAKINKEDLGVYIADGQGEESVIFNLNEKKKFIPASITKLITAGAALEEFAPGTKFTTKILTNAEQKGEVLEGNIYLKGDGDPGFVSETMWFLVNHFVRTGIRTIKGNIVVDDTLFDQLKFDPSRQEERVDRAYDAPTGAMSFNWNSINIIVRPGSKAGEKAKVFLDPENEYTQLKGSVETSAGGGNSVNVSREDGDGGDVVRVSGNIGINSKEVVVFKNVTNPALWSGYNLKSFFSQRGIMVEGKITTGKTPDSASKILAQADGKPIENLVGDMNKFSNNFVAEMLTKRIAAKEKTGSISEGIKSLNEFLKKRGIAESEYNIENPSGLTVKNKISPRGMWKVLQFMHNQFQYEPEFMTSLPIAGVDGTLKNRMTGSSTKRWVRAKTGLLTGVVALAGYAGRPDGEVIPFVFIYNGPKDGSSVRDFFDDMASSLSR